MLLKIDRALVALVLAVGVSAAQAAAYTITVMDLAGGTDSQGWDINNAGVFVGSATVAGEAVGYLVNGGVTTTLSGPAGAISTAALGISDGGIVVGSYSSTKVDDGTGTLIDGPQSGFILVGGSYLTLNLTGAVDTQLRAISADGRYVTGYATMADGSVSSFVYDRTSSSFTTIVNSPTLTIAQGVTNAGLVVGNYREVPSPGPFPAGRFAFTYDTGTGTRTDFSIPTGDIRYRGISETGLIDGFISDASGVMHGFIGSAALFDTFDIAGATSTVLEGINDAGWLAGEYTDAAGAVHAFIARPVSEPSTAALLLAAVVAGAVRRRRR